MIINKISNYLKWHLYWKWEKKKCLADPHYFMTKYWRRFGREGKLQKMKISKDEFTYLQDIIVNGPRIMSKSNIQKYNEHRSKQFSPKDE